MNDQRIRHFSIAMCLWNGDDADQFERCVTSIRDSTLLPRQIVVVVDGPINVKLDGVLVRAIKCFESLGVAWNRKQLDRNFGHGYARSRSLEICECEFVAICDADDINAPDRFERQFEFLVANPNVAVVGGLISEYATEIGDLKAVRTVPRFHAEIARYARLRCPMNQMTVMFRVSEVMAAGGYVDFYHNEDYYLWIRMLKRGAGFHNLQSILVYAKVDPNTYSRRGGIRYFRSEARIQRIMLDAGMIGLPMYLANIVLRVLVQLVMPSKVRRLFFLRLMRTSDA